MERGNILTENVVFILITLTFLSILLVFILIKSSPVSLLEERTAKQIGLIINAAEPGMKISLDLKEVLDKSKIDNPVRIDNEENLVLVKLSEDSGYEYSYFNEVGVLWGLNNGELNMEIKNE
jgi:hypothetical protein